MLPEVICDIMKYYFFYVIQKFIRRTAVYKKQVKLIV